MRRNLKVWNGVGDEFDVATACNAPSVRAWDHAITRVSFGTPSSGRKGSEASVFLCILYTVAGISDFVVICNHNHKHQDVAVVVQVSSMHQRRL